MAEESDQSESGASPTELPQRFHNEGITNILRSLKPSAISAKKLLLVEGQDEIQFFDAMLKHLNILDIQVYAVGGKDQFPGKFPALLNDPTFDQIVAYAIIRDADKSHTFTFESVKSLLEKYGQPTPRKSGEFAYAGDRKVGVFILPGNADSGMLESLCLQAVTSHPAMSCVEQFMFCLSGTLEKRRSQIPQSQQIAYYPKNEEKAKMLAFLSSLYEPTTSIGIAAQKGYWPFDHHALEELRNFLIGLTM